MLEKNYVICPHCKEVSIEGEGWIRRTEATKYYYLHKFNPDTLIAVESHYPDFIEEEDLDFIHEECDNTVNEIRHYLVTIDENGNRKYGHYWKNKQEEADRILLKYLIKNKGD